MRIKSFLPFLLCASCAEDPASPGARSQELVNGDVLSNEQAALSGAVEITDINGGLGNGVLLGEKLVLTANHVLRRLVNGEVVDVPPEEVTVSAGNKPNQVPTGLAGKPIRYPSVTRKRADGSPYDVPIDLAFAKLKLGLAPPVGPFPRVATSDEFLSTIRCISTLVHEIGEDGRPTPNLGTINDVIMGVVDKDERRVEYSPLLNIFGPEQGTAGGDSGMGCYHPATNELVAIQSFSGDDFSGSGTRLVTLRNLIAELQGRPRAAAFEQYVGNGTQLAVVTVDAIAGDQFLVAIDEPGKALQSHEFKLTTTAVLSGGAMGNFGSGRQSLVLIDDGRLTSAGFNQGAAPTLVDVPNRTYASVLKARMNSDKVDDLVAFADDGTLDVFFGNAGNLQFQDTIRPIGMVVDNDRLVDFVWTDGSPTIHISSSRFGTHGVTLPDDINVAELDPGRFRFLSGANNGVEDFAVRGEGIVIWCRTTTFGGFNCENGTLDAPFISGRTATALDVVDLDGDRLDDLTISYAGNQPNRILFGRPTGFPPVAINGRAFTKTRQGAKSGKVIFSDEGGNVNTTFVDEDNVEVGPFDLGVVFDLIFKVLSGNFNDDGEIPNALQEGEVPFEDLVVLNGGTVFTLISNQDGSFAFEELDDATGVVDIAVADVDGDGIDDIETTKQDGSVTVYAGGPMGVDPVGSNFTGLPTPNSEDGKMLLLSGLGVDTVGATQARMRLRVGPEDTAALTQLKVEIFDGNNGGLHQFEEESNLLKTCYQLSADPCGDGNSGNCAGGPIEPVPLLTVSSDTLGDDKWDTIYSGPHSPQASLTGNGLPPFTYQLRVYFSENCATIPSAGAQLSVATADAFKVRSNAMLSQPLGEFSLVGSDSDGAFGLGDLAYMRHTNFDGTFSLPISVGSGANEIQLKESDADDLTDSTTGVSLGANAEIQYRLLKPDGTDASLQGADDGSPVSVVTNPSGNNDGQAALDVETRVHAIVGSGAGVWTWQWENVMAGNALHLFSPFGSPTTHEVMGAWRPRPVVTTAQQPTFWREQAHEVAAQLPIVLGSETVEGVLEGGSILIADSETAKNVLENASGDLAGELHRQLLTAKLNWHRGLALGEDIKGALIYGRTKAVRSALIEADNVVAGFDGLADAARLTDLVALLSAINLGEITYQQPGVPFPAEPMADDDGDGVVNLKDNCPSIANPVQEDADDNWIGDACAVRPSTVCVLQRSEAEGEAIFGYENPLSFRGIPQGARNLLSLNGEALWDTAQPTELLGGTRMDAFRHVIRAGDVVSWSLDGETVSADDSTPICSGRELTRVDLAPQAAIYGTEAVLIGERSSVVGNGGLASVVSGADVVLEASASVGNVFARERVLVGESAVVRGVAATGGGIERAATGVVNDARDFSARPHSLAWWVGFASGAGADVTVQSSQVRQLEPGDYGDVVVAPRAQLQLGAGRYRFRSLVVSEQGSLRIGAGEVVVHVQSRLLHTGDTRLMADDAQLVLGYLGSEPARIDASLEATVVAPHAELTLGSVRQSSYVGSFAAKRVVLRPETQVQYAGDGG